MACDRLSAKLDNKDTWKGDDTERQEVRSYLQHHVVGTSEGVLGSKKCIFETTTIVPDVLHTIYLSMMLKAKEKG